MSKRRSCLHNHRRAYNYCYSPNISKYFITATDTFWLYPIANINSVLTSTTYTRIGNRLIFATKSDLMTFYDNVFASTAASQPLGNQGYSLGVGTIVQDLQTELYLELPNGQLMVTWRLVKQITKQSSLPSGGNSPNDTVGYATVVSNWSAQDFINDVYLDNLSRGHLTIYNGVV
jgi:hypothetical protein